MAASDGERDGAEIVLDLSRLLARAMHPTPTGIDRVEMAYARELSRVAPDRLRFAAVHPCGIYGRLPRAGVERFLDLTETRWRTGQALPRATLRRTALRSLAALLPRPVPRRAGVRHYVQASPHHLTDAGVMATILGREGAMLTCLVHDLIPIQFPEYARPGGAALHARRIATLMRHASGILGNSRATLDALEPYLATAPARPPTAVAHLGTESPGAIARSPPGRPYFLCVGTIEPRKNHLLLLNLWRRWSEERGAAAIPSLVIVGRRGWENEQVVDMLERCPALEGCVEEHGGLPDEIVQQLLAGARGLLLPSFAEGYGMPVSEALALRVPVVCSDLPALREAGGDVPEYLDPLDGPGWRRVIGELASAQSDLAARQAERRRRWRPHGWPEHIAILLDLLHRLPA